MSRAVFLALAIALNVTSKALCSCYTLLALALLNVNIKALLKRFLVLIIRLSKNRIILQIYK
jgi:hypothetical protein